MSRYPEAYINYLIEFHGTRDYFECHEMMEEYWKKYKEKHWHTLIQLAVAVYHERQQNFDGSLRLYRKVLASLRTNHEELQRISIDVERLESIVKNQILNILNEGPYTPFNIPITDHDLVSNCVEICQRKNLIWCNIEDLSNMDLIHRHKRRDRTDVIQERLESKKHKQRKRKG
ncbi:DUF309 domain-containing protein [Evansella tamaricis]|uniref:DUF309 domain-containing protein n=1 Tax=Evansella tamaricis TaxID=2069301 RepID=A0ABS6JM80_9BACI|nr:DUF309 domain-containing protein [Evansella tamaricis]MBU9714778.1 DUF309 domain-containing protein [Evansella tamaricis]